MADAKISFDLVSPERLLLSENAEMVTIPGSEGEMGVMAGHMSLITTLKPGTVDVKIAHGDHHLFLVSGGFAEVTASKITVLAEEAIPVAALDEQTIKQRIIDAEEDIATAKTDTEMAKATGMLEHLKHLRASL